MALPFLPHAEIPAAFAKLQTSASNEALEKVTQYIQNAWVNSTIFPPKAWSVYGQAVRTNNDLEGWHNGLNRRAGGRVHIPFYILG